MSGALLAFNPEAEGTGGSRLLFGVTLPPRPRPRRISTLEEMDLASQFLESRAGDHTTALLAHIIRRAGAVLGRPVSPTTETALLRRLTQSAAVVRRAIRSGEEVGYPMSAEAIFGAELEGLSPEDREFEGARRFVRFAEEMARAAVSAALNAGPAAAAELAERFAAHRLAPGLGRAIAGPAIGFRVRRLSRRDYF
jgi:hypothetical protein